MVSYVGTDEIAADKFIALTTLRVVFHERKFWWGNKVLCYVRPQLHTGHILAIRSIAVLNVSARPDGFTSSSSKGLPPGPWAKASSPVLSSRTDGLFLPRRPVLAVVLGVADYSFGCAGVCSRVSVFSGLAGGTLLVLLLGVPSISTFAPECTSS